MSTRGLYGFRKNEQDKTTYNHSDSYPDWLGRGIATFCSETSIEEMGKIYDSIEMIDEETPPTKEQIKWCIEAGYYDPSVSSQKKEDWYCLLRGMQGDLEELKKNALGKGKTFMSDSQNFIRDSLFCEYAYIINLDTEMLEFWVGYQHEAQEGNRYGEAANEDGYYPCMLAAEFPLAEINSPDDIVEQMNAAPNKPNGSGKLLKRYLDVLERLDWAVSSYTDDGRVELEKYSPAGEDFLMCVEVENFPAAVAEYWEDFDQDEHIEMWIEARRNGTGGVPPTRELVHDAEAIDDMLKELADALAAAEE